MHTLSTNTLRQLARVFVLLCLLSLFVACRTNQAEIAAGLPDPDSAVMTGTAHGFNVYIWNCYEGKKIVIYNTSGEMTVSNYTREEVACGEQSQVEKNLANDKTKRERDPKDFWGRE